ncbi:hypothetical protein [Micromonospora sp. NPDC005652]|uniref:hypothetical protein n=1 Tax=Micromonospora sp. NPDC005652 TaxID=3157046 RepID=UPI0033C56AF5
MVAPSITADQLDVLAAHIQYDAHRPDDRDPRACATCAHRSFPCHRRQAAERVLDAAANTTPAAAIA